jgi:hypothetical protein
MVKVKAKEKTSKSLIEALASELESRNADMGDFFNEQQVAKVDEAVLSLMNAPEALATVQAAREKMQRGSNGRFKPGGGKAVAPKRGAAKPQRKPMNKAISDRKADTTCFDCGKQGHWAGDQGCTMPGAGSFKPQGREICLADHLEEDEESAEPAYIPAEPLVIETLQDKNAFCLAAFLHQRCRKRRSRIIAPELLTPPAVSVSWAKIGGGTMRRC